MSDFFYRQLAKAAQRGQVRPGEQLALKVDLALAHDGSGPQVLQAFRKSGKTVADCSRVLVTFDHAFPAPTVEDRLFQREFADFARHGRIRLFRNGQGVLHQVVAEEESLWPGMIVVGADGHVATAGAFGAIAFSVSPAQFVDAVSSGTHRLTLPEQIVIALEGKAGPGVLARDLAMHLIRHHQGLLQGRAVVLAGTTIDGLNVSERMALCNYLPEGGVATALVLPQGEPRRIDLEIDAGLVTPLVAVPGTRTAYSHPAALAEVPISVAIVGGCSSGRLDDMQIVAEVLARQEVHPEVICIVTPASRNVLASMERLNIAEVLRKAGAVIMPPGCGPCPGRHFGLLSAGDTAIATTIRNNPGRIGAPEARIYLASPLTVALSAVHGKITAPAAAVDPAPDPSQNDIPLAVHN